MNTITAEKRSAKAKANKLRQSGIIPCVIYGGALQKSLLIQMDQRTVKKLFRLKHEGSKIQIKLDDQVIPVQIKENARDILNNDIVHISFQALRADQKVNSIAHIILQNTDKVAGILEKMLLEVPYSALPNDMIDTVTVDLERLPVGSTLTVEDIPDLKNEKIDLQVDADSIILRIKDKKRLSLQDAE